MKILLLFLVFIGLGQSRPPTKDSQRPENGHGAKPLQNDTANADWELGIEYNRYLQEVVQVLESDQDFRKKLENADVDAIRDGTIAHELEFVQHGVRTKLDEIKRKELERLRHLAVRQNELGQGIDKKHLKIPHHLEVRHPTFEVEDLKKLIKSTTKDLEEADRKRREDFKRYEMEKKFEEEERLKHIEDEAKRVEEQERIRGQKVRHREHGKVHHPMTKDQLEEVWENQDHMRAEDWNPKTFFAMHDLNGDNFWDEDEVRVLFRKELDKVYDPNMPEDDMREREEEMERMREHVFKESDTNRDRLISYDEFMAETKKDEFEHDPGWETMDMEDQDVFSDDEFRAFQAQREREIQGLLNRGVVPPGYPYYGNVPPGGQQYQLPPNAGMGGGSIPGQPAYRPEQPRLNQQPQFGQQQQFQQQQPQFGQQQQFQQQQPQFGQQQQYQQQPQFGQQQQFQQEPQRPLQPQQPKYGQQPPQQQPQFQPPPQQQQQPGQQAHLGDELQAPHPHQQQQQQEHHEQQKDQHEQQQPQP